MAKEFQHYLKDAEVAGGVIRTPYDEEAHAMRNALAKPPRPAYAYRIENHGTIFSREVRQTVGHLYRLIDAWTLAFPPLGLGPFAFEVDKAATTAMSAIADM